MKAFDPKEAVMEELHKTRLITKKRGKRVYKLVRVVTSQVGVRLLANASGLVTTVQRLQEYISLKTGNTTKTISLWAGA